MVQISVLINTCYGGFSLSREAAEAVLKRKGIAYRLEKALHGDSIYPFIGNDGWKTVMDVCGRDDPDLIAVVREMGVKAAGGVGTALKIVDFDIKIEIDNYDGIEVVQVYGSEKMNTTHTVE